LRYVPTVRITNTSYIKLQSFIPKLKQHLLPRLRRLVCPDLPEITEEMPVETSSGLNAIVFRNGCIYQHKIMRLNYTTYDVRRDQDILHPSTAQCNVMVLDPAPSDGDNPFQYARVLGIFHANVFYMGDEMRDFTPRRLDFLWVRWYTFGRAEGYIDCLRFPPINDINSFGFLDPADVLRCSHILPLFSLGKVHSDGSGLSHLAKDADDWRSYFVNR
jgi:hypothetical protein